MSASTTAPTRAAPAGLLDRLNEWKRCFDATWAGKLESLLRRVQKHRFSDPAALIRLHEMLLFLRAYPLSPGVARLADQILFGFAERLAGLDLSAFEDPEISGIAGTALTAVFSYEVVQSLAARYARSEEIAWDYHDETADLGPTLSKLFPWLAEDWPVEAHVPFSRWVGATRPRAMSDLTWLLQRLESLSVTPAERAEAWNSMQLPILWNIGRARTSRSRLRLPRRNLFYHREPLLRRADVSIERELQGPPLPVRRLSRSEAETVLNLILDTSAMRYRELYGFSHPDRSAVCHTDLGRGVDLYFFGVPPEWRLPLRAYHAGAFFKNGVPAGYVELLSLFERAEIGFNLYYTFREGESAWLYVRLLRLFHRVLGVNCFTVDPYQIGLENPEALNSGAFWFYRKLGFRPVEPEAARLAEREERRIERQPEYRSSKQMLERLARSYLIYERPSAATGEWDRFTIRDLAIALQSGRQKPAVAAIAAKILAAKRSGPETRYLRLMRQEPRLRSAWIELGSRPDTIQK